MNQLLVGLILIPLLLCYLYIKEMHEGTSLHRRHVLRLWATSEQVPYIPRPFVEPTTGAVMETAYTS